MTGSHQCLHEADLGMKMMKLRAERHLEHEMQKHLEKCMYSCGIDNFVCILEPVVATI